MAVSKSALREKYRRQVAREQGSIVKDPGGRLPVAVVYPNAYRVGMSNLGVHQLYRLLNNRYGTMAERVFYEGPHQQVFSLENFRPLAEFPLVAFSVSYELDYFNIPQMLTSAGIPVYAGQRGENHPLVIAGGACIMANPAPVLPFFDALAIGEAEVLLEPMLEALESAGPGRQARLEALAGVPGMLVPGYSGSGLVKRRHLDDLDSEPCHTAVVTPDAEFGHMYMLEVERGCCRGCKFCLVNKVFSPLRFHSLENLLENAGEGLKYRRHIGLVGPAASMHPRAEELVAGIRRMGGQVSISSLAVKPLSSGLLKELVLAGASSVTLAPEAGSEKLRQNIGKALTEAEILEAVAKVSAAGLNGLKLYFMAGLPREQEEDIVSLKELVLKCLKEFGRRSLNINVAPFVPKPFTAFEREPVMAAELLEEELGYLKSELRTAGVKVKMESPAWSRIQAMLSRGDEKLAPVIASLEKPSLTGWKRALEAAGIDEQAYLGRIPEDKTLPWSIISSL
ncbi:MAG: radical SAM protein [Dehalococcoidaceae bacterium]|nr:radical SAM protein [Dehalococcoidaceae bacterium]